MKRFMNCALVLALLLALAAPARADLIWEPDNDFYRRHGCTHVDRSYYANGPDGFVTLYDAPGGSIVEGQYRNGFSLHVYFKYRDWGCITVFEDEGQVDGWAPLAELALIYDHISFEEEYADRIRDYGGEFADYAGDASVINFYPYPGAPAERLTSSMETDMMDVLANLTGTEENQSYISRVFTDENGLTWGYVNYMYGRLNAWFCLDDPDGTDFPVRDTASPEIIAPRTPTLPARACAPWLLVAAVVAVTGGLLVFFYGKRRKSTR